jgi:hypothetical protein
MPITLWRQDRFRYQLGIEIKRKTASKLHLITPIAIALMAEE